MKKYRGFTLLEMMLVLLIISILVLLFIPKIAEQRGKAQDKSDAAIIQVVDTQMEVYKMDHPNEVVTPAILKEKQYLTDKQLKEYDEAKEREKNKPS